MADIYTDPESSKTDSSQSTPSIGAMKKSKGTFKSRSIARQKRLDLVLGGSFSSRRPDSIGAPLASFCYYPKNVNFINKDPEEEIILLVRRHPITNLGWLVTALFLIVVPAFLTVFPFFSLLPTGFQIISVIVWYLVVTAYILEKYLSWFFQVNIITDERIIDVDFLNLIYREMSDAGIRNIEDVTVKIGGGIRTFFNYGDVVIQTAAQIPQITFEDIARPDLVAKVLRELRIEEEQEQIEGRVR